MDPVSMTVGSMALSAAGGLMGAGGALSEGQATADMFNYKSGLALRNAKIARENKDYALWAGEHESMRYGLKASAERGTMRGQRAASGIDVNTGTNADLENSAMFISDMDMAMIRNNAARRAYAYELDATNEEEQAKLYRQAGANAKTASKYKAASTLIAGASSVSNKWYDASRTGVF